MIVIKKTLKFDFMHYSGGHNQNNTLFGDFLGSYGIEVQYG